MDEEDITRPTETPDEYLFVPKAVRKRTPRKLEPDIQPARSSKPEIPSAPSILRFYVPSTRTNTFDQPPTNPHRGRSNSMHLTNPALKQAIIAASECPADISLSASTEGISPTRLRSGTESLNSAHVQQIISPGRESFNHSNATFPLKQTLAAKIQKNPKSQSGTFVLSTTREGFLLVKEKGKRWHRRWVALQQEQILCFKGIVVCRKKNFHKLF